MKIAAAYIRVSTDDQLEYSPDSQLVQIRCYAKKRLYLCQRNTSLSRKRDVPAIQHKTSRSFCG